MVIAGQRSHVSAGSLGSGRNEAQSNVPSVTRRCGQRDDSDMPIPTRENEQKLSEEVAKRDRSWRRDFTTDSDGECPKIKGVRRQHVSIGI